MLRSKVIWIKTVISVGLHAYTVDSYLIIVNCFAFSPVSGYAADTEFTHRSPDDHKPKV